MTEETQVAEGIRLRDPSGVGNTYDGWVGSARRRQFTTGGGTARPGSGRGGVLATLGPPEATCCVVGGE